MVPRTVTTSTEGASSNSSENERRSQQARVRVKIDRWERQDSSIGHRVRLFAGRQCVFMLNAAELDGKTDDEVAAAQIAVDGYERMRSAGSRRTLEAATAPSGSAPGAATSADMTFPFADAKKRFLDGVEQKIGPDRRAEIEVHFCQSIEPFFLEQHACPDPQRWPPMFDLFRSWLVKDRLRMDGQPGHIKARTANCYMASLNKFLKFCREVYGLNISSNCRRFSSKVVERESRVNGENGVTALHNVWTEEEFARFRKVAYELEPRLAPVFDLCFGLGLRRGEAMALQVGCVHLDDGQLGPLGYVEVKQQYTRSRAQGRPVVKLPKWEKTRAIPIPYPWLQEALRDRISRPRPIEPRNNKHGLRYVAKRYPTAVIAAAMGVTGSAVRKWLCDQNIVRTNRPPTVPLTEEVAGDIRFHLEHDDRPMGADDFLLADVSGRLPLPDHIHAVSDRIAAAAGLRRIRVHDLRHSFGSIWAQRLSLTVLKEMMGHASIKTTERYIHTTGEVFRLSISQAIKNMREEVEMADAVG